MTRPDETSKWIKFRDAFENPDTTPILWAWAVATALLVAVALFLLARAFFAYTD